MDKMPPGYRETLRRNLSALMDARELDRDSIKAVYLDGTKKGLFVSPRSIGNMLSESAVANSPTFDMIAAVAARLGVEAWMLFVDDVEPDNLPVVIASAADRRLFRTLLDVKSALGAPAGSILIKDRRLASVPVAHDRRSNPTVAVRNIDVKRNP